jgi:hypothetical protein
VARPFGPGEFTLVDFTGSIGAVELSTHDDGEATFKVATEREAGELLSRVAGVPVAAIVFPHLLANMGCYVALRNGVPNVYPSFEAYLAGA